MGEYWAYGVNNDMDDEVEKRFDKLSDADKDALEKEFRDREEKGKSLSKREIKDFISIKEERGQVDYLKDMWNQGKFYGQKEGYEGAEQNFKDELKTRFNKIRGIKQANPESKFIQEAKDTIQIDPDAGIMQAGVLPSFDSLKTAWGKFTEAGDENLSDFDITSTMGVGTPKVLSGLSTDVYESKAPIAYETFDQDKEFQAYEKFNPTLDRRGIADLIAQAEEEEEYNTYLSQIAGMPKGMSPFKKWSRDFWEQPGKRLLQGANIALNPFYKDNPINMGISYAAQNLNLPDLRGGQTQDAYNKARQERIRGQRIRQRTSDRTQANIEAWNNAERQRKFEEETQRLKNIQMQQQAQQVQQNIQTHQITGGGGQGGDRPDTGMNRPGGGWGQSPTGGNVAGTPFYTGGRVGFSEGGIVGLWRELSNL